MKETLKKIFFEKKFSYSTLLVVILSYCFDMGLLRFLFFIVGCYITIKLTENYEFIKIEKNWNDFIDVLKGEHKDGN